MLWVDIEGNVHIDQIPEELSPIGYAATFKDRERFRYETYISGNAYVGPEAPKDQAYLTSLLGYLKRDWEAGTRGYIDY